MVDEASKTVGFTPDAFWIALGVFIAVIGLAVLIMNAIKLYRDLRKPKNEGEKTVQDKLNKDHERLTRLEESTAKQEEELKLLLRSNLVMIHHMVDGNGTQGLKDMQQQIEDYLVFGKVREEHGK